MSSAADPTAAFLSALGQSNLLGPARMQTLAEWATLARPDVPALAKELNRRGWLTPYQIKEVFKGRGRALVVDRYVLLDLLGEGGMGRVFKAHDTRLGRDVALKIIRKERLTHPAAMARFGQEMLALGKLQHPNVVQAFDASQTGDTHFVVMEFLDGLDLTRLVRERGPLPVAEACYYVQQAALGLHHAHESGLVHRDIKPSNILVGRDGRTVKLVDLGLARLHEAAGEGLNRVTLDGFVIGTPDFLAPEQARNPAGVDIRADVYALGATLFYLLTAKVPFDGANATEKLLKHCTDPPPPLRPLRPDAPPPVEQIVHWCLAKRPEDRPQTPLQLAMALHPFCPQPSPGYHAPAPPGYPYPAPPAAPEPAPSSQLFKLPAQTTDADPIRRRAEQRFPVGLLLVGLGSLFVVGVFAFGVYRVFIRGFGDGPVEPFANAVGMKLVKIDGGTFKMGSPAGEPGRPAPRPDFPDDEGPVHEVTIAGPFLMSATEVTHNQYTRVMGSSPPQSPTVKFAANASEHPADAVSHEDAVEFCRRLTEKDKGQPHARSGWAYRLPTEAEWEYACRAGTDTPFGVGSKDRLVFRPQLKQALFTVTGTDPVEDGDAVEPSQLPGKVGQFPPNAWGLYDMHGNVAEWCQDWYRPGYPGDGPRDNPLGPASGDKKVVRGGSFRDPASACRSAARSWARPSERRDTIGFRVVYAPK
jgi:serine/threonine protein kinase/formylglycine-generating enzyme required for sulfatase activity